MGKSLGIGLAGVALVCAAIVTPVAAAAPQPVSTAAPALIAEVQTALDRGDAHHAANLADNGLKLGGIGTVERARLQLYHGLAQELLGASDAAMHDFTLALASRALPPAEQAQALLQRGFLRDGLGRVDEAASDYSAVIALKSEGFTTALNNRANIYRRQNKWTEAKADYQAALGAGGGRAQYSWYGLGQIAEAQGDSQGARGFYAKAVAADPAYAAASQRMAALGGPPEGAIANPVEPIVLRPPAAKQAADKTADPGGAAADLSPDRPIMLKPPSRRVAAAAPATRRTADWQPAPRHGASAPPPRLNLRPALDRTAEPRAGAVRATPVVVPTTVRAGLSGPQVQLGAWRSEAEARTGWQKAQAQAGALLQGRTPRVVTADLPGRGRYFRLRISAGAGESPADLCETLAARNVACFPARD